MQRSLKTLAAVLLAATAYALPVLAERILTGPEVQKLLAGRRFDFQCMDGTRGYANYDGNGSANAVYRMSTARETDMETADKGVVRMAGENICIRWQQLNDGREGCYRMTERKPGLYRISTVDTARWCDLSANGTF